MDTRIEMASPHVYIQPRVVLQPPPHTLRPLLALLPHPRRICRPQLYLHGPQVRSYFPHFHVFRRGALDARGRAHARSSDDRGNPPVAHVARRYSPDLLDLDLHCMLSYLSGARQYLTSLMHSRAFSRSVL
jgi:hypothetical protein